MFFYFNVCNTVFIKNWIEILLGFNRQLWVHDIYDYEPTNSSQQGFEKNDGCQHKKLKCFFALIVWCD